MKLQLFIIVIISIITIVINVLVCCDMFVFDAVFARK